MKIVIAGVSRGIGLSLVQHYLKHGFSVLGIGRNNVVEHPRFSFIPCNLSDIHAVETLDITHSISSEESFVFIYNAGILGEIKHTEKQTLSNSSHVFQVNYVSAVMLTQKLLQHSINLDFSTIAFISSGAGKRAIASWSQYCASKAALDMFAQTLQLEMNEVKKNVQILSISPGVVDTKMQVEIRSSNQNDFSSHANFVALKNEGKLLNPEYVASSIFNRIALFDKENVFYRVE
jgi:benzil reductase ((S)-benzoin forming)